VHQLFIDFKKEYDSVGGRSCIINMCVCVCVCMWGGVTRACVRDTWSTTMREDCRLRVFQNRVLRRIFGRKRDEVTGE